VPVPPFLTEQERAERVEMLLALEIARIVDDLTAREQFLIDIWGRHRERGPFLDTIFSQFKTLTFRELALIEPDTLLKIQEFYRELDDFRMYLLFTEAMPTSLAEAYRWQLKRLAGYGAQAVEALGGEPERPILHFPDEEEDDDEHPLIALAHFEEPDDDTSDEVERPDPPDDDG
jgi:hypothetical protein